MILGELREHPDFNKLVSELHKMLDIEAARVLVASREADFDRIRRYGGRHEMLTEVINQISGKER